MQEFAWHPAELAEELTVLKQRGYSVTDAAKELGVNRTKAYEALRFARAAEERR